MEENSSPAPFQEHLITHISYKDAVPEGWNLRKKGRYSVGDIQELQTHLEGIHGINTKSTDRQRRASAPAATAPFSRGLLDHLEGWYRRLHLPQLPLSRAALPQINLPQVTLPHITLQQQDRLRLDLQPMIQASFDFAMNTLFWSMCILKTLLHILKWPLIILVATTFTLLAVLNVFATVYTVTHDSFLNHFCKKELPVLRGLLCTSWDALQEQRGLDQSEQLNLNQAFQRYLLSQNEDNTLSWAFPHQLARWESCMRRYRASLPESEFQPSDREYFEAAFSAYIELSISTTNSAQDFYAHIMATIQLHLSDTDWLVRTIHEKGITSNVTIYIDGPLAQSMAFLNTYYIVYLIGGIEPFQTDLLQTTTVEAAQLMNAHLGFIIQRLNTDIDMAIGLERQLLELSSAAEAIERHISKCTSGNNKALITLPSASVWDFLSSKTRLERKLSKYEIDQQRVYLGHLRPDIQQASAFLRESAQEFRVARDSCKGFKDRLDRELPAAEYGWKSEWITKQAKTMHEGVGDLKFSLQNFKLKEMRFDDRLFQRESSEEGQRDSSEDGLSIGQ